LKKGEKIMIEMRGLGCAELVRAVIKEVYNVGGVPFLRAEDNRVTRELLMGVNEGQLKIRAEHEIAMMKQMDAWIGIGVIDNMFENIDVPQEKTQLAAKFLRPVTEERITKKWVGLRYPTAGMAQSAKMSQDQFEDFYYNVCCLDYGKMDRAMEPLKVLMEKTDKVQIKGEGTDLTFSIKGIPAIKCSGQSNIPDGEIYTAPVKNSVNGYVTYNTPSMMEGFSYENVRLEFKDGKIVKATANDTARINSILDRDEGARYTGEFAFGVNPFITEPMNNILFDEKIAGSFHFTPGSSYQDADNGNRSDVHWDLVCIQTPEYGGGEIYFDDVLIRKDGRFVLEELKVLNPENLK